MKNSNEYFALDPTAKERERELTNIIRQEIAATGPISFARFMELALYHPQFGYYLTRAFQEGHTDFVTAPELSPLFAQCFAEQIQEIACHPAQFLARDPAPSFNILEIGAGSGKFARDVLLSLKKHNALPQKYFIVDISPTLKEKQKKLIQQDCPEFLDRITWLDHVPEEFSGVIIANEVLDAMPVHLFQIGAQHIDERCVDFKHKFVWKNIPAQKNVSEKISLLRNQYQLPNDYCSEINLGLSDFFATLTQNLKQGVMFIIDYGYGQSEYYRADRTHGTLKCFYQHHHHDDPLILVGQQDITAHVDFTRVVDQAMDAGFELAGYTTQGAFLLACGLMELVTDSNHIEAIEERQTVKKLTMPGEMGELVKVMALTKNIPMPLRGFSLQDRRRAL